jgi:hypothetical protein
LSTQDFKNGTNFTTDDCELDLLQKDLDGSCIGIENNEMYMIDIMGYVLLEI